MFTNNVIALPAFVALIFLFRPATVLGECKEDSDCTNPWIGLVCANGHCRESVAWYLIRDPENDGKKCGDSPDSSNRSFKLTGSTATTRNCYAFCKHDKDCVAFSGVYEKWCIGCKVALSSPHEGAEAFKRTVPGKADVDNNELVTEKCGMNCPELRRAGGPPGCIANACKDKNFDFVKHCPESCSLRDCAWYGGIQTEDPWNRVCCAASCGKCGGEGCEQRPGGAENCCPKILRRSVDTSKKHHAQIQCFLNFITIISLKETIFPSSLCLK